MLFHLMLFHPLSRHAGSLRPFSIPIRRHVWAAGALVLVALPASAQLTDPNDPGVLEPVLTALNGVEVRIPNTDQVVGGSLANMVGPIVTQGLLGSTSLTGATITDTSSPNLAMRDALDDMSSAAAGGDAAGMVAAANELDAVLRGTTSGRVYDGFAMLNYNRGAFVPGHVAGEYKLKEITDSGLTAPGMDGQPRKIWEVDVNFLWYDGQFDSDTFMLRIPVEANPFDTLRVHYTIRALEGEDFAPTCVMVDHRAPGSVQFPFKGLDSVWTKVNGGSEASITVDFPPLRELRGIYTWGWRQHPPRIQFIQPVFEMVNAHTGLVELEPQGRSFVERNRLLAIDDIADAAPEKKMYDVCLAALGGASTASISAMLDNAGVAPAGTWSDWADLAEDQLQIPDEAWDVLATEGLSKGNFGPYRFISAYMNNEMYGRGATDKAKIDGWRQGDGFQVKLINLDKHTHYFRNVDFGPKLHDDMAAAGFPSASHSSEIMNFKPSYGAPKVAEVQWRAGWGFRPHYDVIQQQDVFPRDSDQSLWRHYFDGGGTMRFGYQYSAATRGGDFVFNPPNFIIGSTTAPSAFRLKEDNGSDGLLIGMHTEGYGVAKMCSHADHPLGGFCQTDISAFNPNGSLNVDTDGDGVNDVLWFPPFLRNPDPVSGGDIIPPTPAWKPFLWINPANGSLLIDPADPSQGYWADRTFAHGTPVPAGAGLSATIEAPRASAQVFYQFDDLYHDNAIFSPHPETAISTAAAVNLGFGTAGANGKVPYFSAVGSMATGGTTNIGLVDAAPLSTAWLIVSAVNSSVPFKGGTLVPGAPFVAIPLVTDAAGSISFVVGGGHGPLDLFTQFVVQDAGAPPGFVLSNALEVKLLP